MKIAYFLDFPGCFGGSNKVLLTQAYIMSKKGYEVVVIIPNDENGQHVHEFDEISKSYELNVVIIEFYPVATTLEGIDILRSLECCDKIKQLLLKEKVDFVHSIQINVTVEMVSRELGIPHLMNIYQIDSETFRVKWLDVYPHYHSADSNLFSRRWGEGLHIPSKCIRVAYKDNCQKKRNKKKSVSDPLQILSIGVLSEQKNQLEVIKFVLECKKRGMRVVLTILGKNDTFYGGKCKEFVEQNRLEKEVLFLGVVLNIEDYFAQSDLMILSSVVESYPGVIVESMANKVPVISTPVAGIPELLSDGYNSFLTSGSNCADICAAFDNFLLYKKDGRIQDIINHAYETYEQNHSYEVVGEQLKSYYDWILENYKKQNSCVQIQDVKSIWSDFVEKKKLRAMDMPTQNNLWFLYHLDKRIHSHKPKRIAIWGAGYWGKIVLEWLDILDCRDKFIGFIDTYKKGKYLDCPILDNMDQTIKDCDMIFVAIYDVGTCREIMRHLEKYKKTRNVDYFTILHDPIRI